MNIDDFVLLLSDDLGLPVTSADVETDFDELAGWDSMHLLSLLSALERATGRRVSLPDMLEATNLRQIHALAVAP